jgi:hypothetical protein
MSAQPATILPACNAQAEAESNVVAFPSGLPSSCLTAVGRQGGAGQGGQAKLSLPSEKTVGRIALGFVPFTPVEFFGKEAWIAWTRLGVYSLLAYATYNKIRPVSYAAMGAIGVSLATSLMGKAWHS